MAAKQRNRSIYFTIDTTGLQALQALIPGEQWEAPDKASATTETILYIDTNAFDLFRRGTVVTVQPDTEQFVITAERQPLPDLIDKAAYPSEPTAVRAKVRSIKRALNPSRWPAAIQKVLPPLPTPDAACHPVALIYRIRYDQTVRFPPTLNGDVQDAEQPETVPVALEEMQIALPPPTLPKLFEPQWSTQLATLYDVQIGDEATGSNIDLLQKRLCRQIDLAPVIEGRFSRILAAIGSHAPVMMEMDGTVTVTARAGIQPTMSMAAACRMLIYQQLLEMIRQEAGVRYSAEIEYVHQMRVAIRRLRAAAKLFGESMERKRLRPYLKQVRKTGRLLGAVRDLDVAIDKAQKRKRTRNTEQIDRWRQQRAEAHAALVTWLDSEGYQQFLANFLAFCAPTREAPAPPQKTEKRKTDRGTVPPDATSAAMQPAEVRHVVPGLLMDRFAAVRCYETAFTQDGPIPYETLHELRIECKYLRYSLEFTEHLLGPESKAVIKELKQLQELLGDLNDAVVAIGMVDAQQTKRMPAKQKEYRKHQEEVIDKLRAAVPTRLAELVGPENRRKFGAALANL